MAIVRGGREERRKQMRDNLHSKLEDVAEVFEKQFENQIMRDELGFASLLSQIKIALILPYLTFSNPVTI
jgi:ferredoxin-fold anticodon binding domain-containing protein